MIDQFTFCSMMIFVLPGRLPFSQMRKIAALLLLLSHKLDYDQAIKRTLYRISTYQNMPINTQIFEVNQGGNNGTASNIESIVAEFRRSDDELQQESELQPPHNLTLQDTAAATTTTSDINKKENHHSVTDPLQSYPFRFVPLTMGGESGRTHVVSNESRQLILDEVTLDDLMKMTSLFYEKVFQDPTLDKFIRDRSDPHGIRFAKWIHQKLSGSHVWDADRQARNLQPVTLANNIQHVVHDRSSAHAAAWYSPKRPSQEVGRHFQLDECRVWMRLHFWALRESGIINKSPSFADYYIRFIGHFVRVYESTAPNFARDSFRWSADPSNIETYIRNGCRMDDVLNLSLSKAKKQISSVEANDHVWPYHKKQSSMVQ